MVYPSGLHATTDVVGGFRMSLYLNASMSMIIASCDSLKGSRSTIAECGLHLPVGILSVTADGMLMMWQLDNTLHLFE